MKQTKLRRRRVIRYAILYFVLLVVVLALIVGPAVAGKFVPKSISEMSVLKNNGLVQPTGQNNDDTLGHKATGTGMDGYSGVLASAISASKAAAAATGRVTSTASAANRMALLV